MQDSDLDPLIIGTVRGSGSVSKCHRYATLKKKNIGKGEILEKSFLVSREEAIGFGSPYKEMFLLCQLSRTQRVLNDLLKTRLSRRRMILLPPTLSPTRPPSPVSKLGGRHTGRLRKRDNLLTAE